MELSTPVRAVFLDIDDTIFDHRFAAFHGLKAVSALHEVLRLRDLNDVETLYLRLLDEMWPRVMSGELGLNESRAERFRLLFSACAIDATEADAWHAAEAYRAAYLDYRRPIEGARELLGALRSHAKLALVTNNFVQEQRDKLRVCELAHPDDELVTAEEVGAWKPEPRIFRVALERVGCAPHETVMFGDSWSADVLGATALGTRAVWLNRRGIVCPDPNLAREVRDLLPTSEVARAILRASD